MNRIVCRTPYRSEAEATCALVSGIVASDFPRFPAEAVESYLRPWTPVTVRARLELGGDVLIIACDGDRAVGAISGAVPEAGVGTVIWLVIDKEYRGQGVGRALYNAACDAYRKLGAHKLKLTAPDEGSRQFYERCGMRTEGVHPDHWHRLSFFSLGATL